MKAVYTLAIAAILLAIVGAAYAAWTEQLTIKATVNTGELDVAFDENSLSVTDNGADPQAAGYNNNEGFDVASASLQVTDSDDEGDAIELTFTIDNAYPGYSACAQFNIVNIGTIPAEITKIDLSDVQAAYPDGSTGTANDALSISYTMNVGDTLESGESKSYQVCVEVTEQATEMTSYSFSITIEFTQWNAQ